MTPAYPCIVRAIMLAAALCGLGVAQAQPETPMPPLPDHPAKPVAQRHSGPNGEPPNAGRLATREGHPQDFERNALARCEAFQSQEDRRFCVERTRRPVAGGSVGEGGVLREYTESVPAQ